MQKQWFTHTKYWRVILATKYKILESNFDNKIYSIQSEGICGLLTSETEASPIMRRHETNRAMSATDPESRKNASCLILNTVWIQNWTQGSRLSYKNKKRKDKRDLQISVATSKKIKKKKMGRIFVVELDGRSYRCKFCRTHLALPEDLVSRVLNYVYYYYYFYYYYCLSIVCYAFK